VALLPRIQDPELLGKRASARESTCIATAGSKRSVIRLRAWSAGSRASCAWSGGPACPRWRLAITCALEHFTAIGAARALRRLACFLWVDGVLFTWPRLELSQALSAVDATGTIWRDYALYYKMGLHPSQLDDHSNLDRSRGELASSPYYAAAR
jgi:predicted metal-dependent hydrolase